MDVCKNEEVFFKNDKSSKRSNRQMVIFCVQILLALSLLSVEIMAHRTSRNQPTNSESKPVVFTAMSESSPKSDPGFHELLNDDPVGQFFCDYRIRSYANLEDALAGDFLPRVDDNPENSQQITSSLPGKNN
jgi:hypothetical protein